LADMIFGHVYKAVTPFGNLFKRAFLFTFDPASEVPTFSFRCAENCHFGNCAVCTNVSFEELRCYCGSKVTYPPIACGTKPPPCSEPCRRVHLCSHEVRHNCHSEVQCPPCAALTEKWCHGKHEVKLYN
jgi:hypothetical protein